MTLPPACTYVPWNELTATPNIMVDGAARDGTLITLSHWPQSGTPENLKADSSTDIVFEYLNMPTMHVPTAIVTGDHFDEDACLGIFTLLDPEFAQNHRDLICDAANAGDFSTCQDRQAARVAFSILAFSDPSASPLNKNIFNQGYDDMCGDLFREVLPRIKPIIEHIDTFKELWQPEDDFLQRSEDALIGGGIAIQEHPDVSLCVVIVSEDLRSDADRVRVRRGDLPYHPMVIFNATECDRILTIMGNIYILSYRYESWVQYISAPPMPRVDLHPLAVQLSERELGSLSWSFDGVETITPLLQLKNADGNVTESALSPDDMIECVVAYLEGAEAAWDPFDHPGEKPGALVLPH